MADFAVTTLLPEESADVRKTTVVADRMLLGAEGSLFFVQDSPGAPTIVAAYASGVWQEAKRVETLRQH